MGNQENIDLKRILDILKGKKLMIVVILVLFTLFGCLYSYKYVVPKYKSTSTLLLIPESTTITNSDLNLNSGLISTYSNIADNSKILNKVIENLGLNMTAEKLSKNIQVRVIEDTYIIQITVTDLSATKAMEISKEVTNVFLDEIRELYNLNNIGVVDEAQLPVAPYNINHKRDIGISVLLGILTSIVIAILIYTFDNTIKEENDIEKYLKIKPLGSIPIYNNKEQEIVNKHDGKSYVAECINTIRTNILYMNSTKDAKTILITSCVPREGKSWTSANIAVSFAETNKKVLLIDADMRKGRASKIFNIHSKKGLSDYLYSMTGNATEDIELGNEYIKETEIPNLHILTNGTMPPNPSELIGSNKMEELLKIFKNAYDIIILDAPPCKLVTDSVVLSTITDSTVLVVNAGKTKLNDLQEVNKSIQNVDGQIIGAILNQTKVKGKVYSKNYYYGHSEDLDNNKKEQKGESVSDVLEFAKTKAFLQPEKSNNIKETKIEKDKSINETEGKQLANNSKQIKNIIDEQNKYFEKVTDVIANINAKLNNIKEKDYTKDIDEVKKQISDMDIVDYTEDINEIKKQVSDIDSIDYSKDIKEIKKQISNINNVDYSKDIKQIKKQISNINNVDYSKDIKEIKKQISNVDNVDYTEDINEIKKQISDIDIADYTEEIEKLYEQILDLKSYTSKMMIETINNNNTLLESAISQNNKTILEEVKANIEKMDYGSIIEEINQKIQKNIVDIKELQAKKENKMAYSIDEEIPYEELEKTAMYVIPIPKTEEPEEDLIDNYKTI